MTPDTGILRPETDRFLRWIKKESKKYQVLMQGHAEGKNTSVDDDLFLQKIWAQYLLSEDPFDN